jgi:glyceraldehyde 3-phosphate dehydrogenase
MTIRLAVNGFGRIGRLFTRLFFEQSPEEIELVAINDIMDAKSCAYLYKHDSVHGATIDNVEFGEDWIRIGGRRISVTRFPDPSAMQHLAFGIDLVIEASGQFTDRRSAVAHLTSGARRVLLSAPSGGADITIVQGVNEGSLRQGHIIVSNASCTTNALAPIAAVLDAEIGIRRGHMTTVHAYTNDQRLLDQHHPDMRRSRGAALSMIPTSTGATKAVIEVLPQLAGKLSGASVRVPVANVSLVDFVLDAARPTSAEEVNAVLAKAAAGSMLPILAVTNQPLVSSDFNHTAVSATIDQLETKVIEGQLVRVVGWYDNEWGFANRLFETAMQMANQMRTG